MRVLRAGPFGVVLEFERSADVRRCFRAVRELRGQGRGEADGVIDVVPAERTVLLVGTFDDAGLQAVRELVRCLGEWEGSTAGGAGDSLGVAGEAEAVELAIRYDGPDLATVAELTGLSIGDVVRLHGAAEYTVAFTGFAPGFAYLAGLPPELEVPRRSVPRTRVEAGAVGLAGPYSGVYPRASPGGWQIIGHLAPGSETLWDSLRTPPALLQPGARVRFRAVDGDRDESPEFVGAGAEAEPAGSGPGPGLPTSGETGSGEAGMRVVRVGLLTTVQDLGRPGFGHLGVSRAGAVDRPALMLANRLVGNDEGAAALETTVTGCAVEFSAARWVAVTGARAPVSVDGRGVGQGAAFYVRAGSVIEIGAAQVGVRCYLAVAGGIDSTLVLGSRSADLLSGVGHDRLLAAGDLLPLGKPAGLPPDLPGIGIAPLRDAADPVVLRLLPGPRDDWFGPDALAVLATSRYVVSAASNRTALRLDGPALRRVRTGELPSEGLVPGAVQVPPDGRPVLFLADHPVTGGYPVIGCVHPDDLPAAGQARPGSGLRFRISPAR